MFIHLMKIILKIFYYKFLNIWCRINLLYYRNENNYNHIYISNLTKLLNSQWSKTIYKIYLVEDTWHTFIQKIKLKEHLAIRKMYE